MNKKKPFLLKLREKKEVDIQLKNKIFPKEKKPHQTPGKSGFGEILFFNTGYNYLVNGVIE